MTDIKEVLFWVFMVLSIILVLWYVFGNSPSEFLALVALIMTSLFKTWSVSDRLLKLEMRFTALEKNGITLQNDFHHHLQQGKS